MRWIALACALICIASSASAQVPDPAPPGFWTEFYAAAKTAGWFGTLIMTLMWWLERGERRELQLLLHGDRAGGGVLKEMLKAFYETKDALKDMAALIGPRKQ